MSDSTKKRVQGKKSCNVFIFILAEYAKCHDFLILHTFKVYEIWLQISNSLRKGHKLRNHAMSSDPFLFFFVKYDKCQNFF